MSWVPKRSLAEVETILCAPGMPHEMETRFVHGRLQRVYKNIWPSLRVFWLHFSNEHKDKTYVVYENQRISYTEVFSRSLKAASVYKDIYGVRKGERIGICSRNFPDYLTAWWGCQLIGAVAVLTNAWVPLEAQRYCLTRTDCKVIILDPERADRLEPIVAELAKEAGTRGFLVLESREGKGKWNGMEVWDDVLRRYDGDVSKIVNEDPHIVPEDNACIMFTSGTTGLPKGVLSTQRQYVTNVLNVTVGSRRAALRRGEDIPVPLVDGTRKGILISVPLFHVTGSTSLAMLACMAGLKIVLIRKWDAEQAARWLAVYLIWRAGTNITLSRLINQEDVAIAGGVPSMVSELMESSAAGYPLEGLLFGGAPAHPSLPDQAKKIFPNAAMSQGYGLTETNSIAVAMAGEDYVARPTSTGLPMPVNDVIIVRDGVALPPNEVGEIWIRGPNVMKEYWRDPEATARAVTEDGWFKTGDLGTLDEQGFVYIRDRMKDIIIRGGENIDSVAVENALYEDDRISEAAAVGIPDRRLGEVVSALVCVKPAFRGTVTEAQLIDVAKKRLPKYAVPVMVIVQNKSFERTPSEKIVKGTLRKIAKAEWERRSLSVLPKL